LDFREDRLLNRARGLAPGQRNLNQGTVQEIFQQQFQTVSDVYSNNPENKFYIGKVPLDVIQKDIDAMKAR
jgi:hypothetical protein